MEAGRDVLIVMTTSHSTPVPIESFPLLLRRPLVVKLSRDIFYIHSRLLGTGDKLREETRGWFG